MSRRAYWKQQIPLLCLHVIGMVALLLFLAMSGNSVDTILLIGAVWGLVLTAYLWKAYADRKSQLEALLALTEQLEERYLIAEMIGHPSRADDLVYYQILKLAGKSMLEQVGAAERERVEYKEYIEQWIHEIKTPITAMKLLCENRRRRGACVDGAAAERSGRKQSAGAEALEKHLNPEFVQALLVELEKVNLFTEQALYYARSEHAEKDYAIHEVRLFYVVHKAIAENKYLLLQNGIRLDVRETEDMVYCDEKWLCFILNQLIVNAVKYRSEHPELCFYTEKTGDIVRLCVKDNGIGIAESDLPRIFEKGFTGKNGRLTAANATGIGLYLCKRLCEKLGIGISAESMESSGSGTIMRLTFRINDYIHEVQE